VLEPAKRVLKTFYQYSYSFENVAEDYRLAIEEKHPDLNVRAMKMIEKYFLKNLSNKATISVYS
jgi:hypothetical protein